MNEHDTQPYEELRAPVKGGGYMDSMAVRRKYLEMKSDAHQRKVQLFKKEALSIQGQPCHCLQF